MCALNAGGAILYLIAVAYMGIGVLHSIYFSLFIIRSDCIAATKGIVYLLCHTGIGISHFVVVVAWPWFRLS
jgi:hypothetical protein